MIRRRSTTLFPKPQTGDDHACCHDQQPQPGQYGHPREGAPVAVDRLYGSDPGERPEQHRADQQIQAGVAASPGVVWHPNRPIHRRRAKLSAVLSRLRDLPRSPGTARCFPSIRDVGEVQRGSALRGCRCCGSVRSPPTIQPVQQFVGVQVAFAVFDVHQPGERLTHMGARPRPRGGPSPRGRRSEVSQLLDDRFRLSQRGVARGRRPGVADQRPCMGCGWCSPSARAGSVAAATCPRRGCNGGSLSRSNPLRSL